MMMRICIERERCMIMEENKKLYRSNSDKKLFGVCGGIAEYFNVDSTIVRLIVIVIALACGVGLIGYLLAALIMPKKPN